MQLGHLGLGLTAINPNPELVSNGNFSSSDGWTLGTNWSIGSGLLTGAAVPNFTVSSADIAVTPGVAYAFAFDINAVSAGSVRAGFLGGTTVLSNNFATTGIKTFELTALSGNNTVFIGSAGAGFTGSINSISVTKA